MGDSERSTKRLRIRWDEGNLSENERIKAELNPRKIEEPKTPFHSPPREEDFDMDEDPEYDPAKLNVENGAHKDTEATSSGGPSGVAENGNANHAPVTVTSGDDFAGQPEVSEEPLTTENGEPLTTENGEPLTSENGDALTVENGDAPMKNHRYFDAQRKAHYNMAEALKRGKELLEQEEEGE
ncbi:hypothetical protein BSKO_06913 [Bryopsis sp. KO-2023]|nr:hypothetical protein BSKO_06913 [Bryopsis sp. KO-2023]